MSFVKHLGENFKPGGVAVRVRALRAGWSWMAEELVESNVFARMKISVPEVAHRNCRRRRDRGDARPSATAATTSCSHCSWTPEHAAARSPLWRSEDPYSLVSAVCL